MITHQHYKTKNPIVSKNYFAALSEEIPISARLVKNNTFPRR